MVFISKMVPGSMLKGVADSSLERCWGCGPTLVRGIGEGLGLSDSCLTLVSASGPRTSNLTLGAVSLSVPREPTSRSHFQ